MDLMRERLSAKMEHIFKQANLHKSPQNASSIMRSMDYPILDEEDLLEDLRPKYIKADTQIQLEAPFQSLPLVSQGCSFQLVDPQENVLISSVDELMHLLECPDDAKTKVVSIFGHSGDGKSHTLNHLFFRGKEVFKTSSDLENGTQGIWAAWQPSKKVICLDTPPINHPDTNHVLLFKILALSDVVIYRTRAERLPADMYKFLGEASQACQQHFQRILSRISMGIDVAGSESVRGPAVIINHEPRHTPPLKSGEGVLSPEEQIISSVKALELDVLSLGPIHYAPSLPTTSPPTAPLLPLLHSHLDSSSVRLPRRIAVFFESLVTLSDRFRGRLVCDEECKCCQARCTLSMGHDFDGIKHITDTKCKYLAQFDNKVYLCQGCRAKVKEINGISTQESLLGFARSAWNGYELHCPRCGPIYRSRQYWYGNKTPEEHAVITEIIHVWPGSVSTINPSGVGVRKALEGVGSLTGALASCWLADAIAPTYWQPTSEITHCSICKCKLEAGCGEIHHCRWCGLGVCGPCSTTRRPVPHRGWARPVRVCDVCRNSHHDIEDSDDVTARKMGEAVSGVLSPFTSALQYPKDLLKDLARPSYWIPDEQAPACAVCSVAFGNGPDCTVRHHCRKCGQSVCATCSPYRAAVPERGWTSPVRVCRVCFAEKLE